MHPAGADAPGGARRLPQTRGCDAGARRAGPTAAKRPRRDHDWTPLRVYALRGQMAGGGLSQVSGGWTADGPTPARPQEAPVHCTPSCMHQRRPQRSAATRAAPLAPLAAQPAAGAGGWRWRRPANGAAERGVCRLARFTARTQQRPGPTSAPFKEGPEAH
ncbi:MAG: hypothetical protein J3K34DRAFT_406772 [Monoraphidium minutum]|nr:MAG: hypothetical protein J3K34DRAFT_406772 [Monoraphidium minutum]